MRNYSAGAQPACSIVHITEQLIAAFDNAEFREYIPIKEYWNLSVLGLDQTDMISRIAERLRALGDETRIRMLLALKEGESPVGVLAKRLRINQASASKHLAVLKGAGLVTCRREGTQTFYTIHDDTVFDMCALVCRGVITHLRAQQALLAGVLPARKGRSA